jgi:hypothetical protein
MIRIWTTNGAGSLFVTQPGAFGLVQSGFLDSYELCSDMFPR